MLSGVRISCILVGKCCSWPIHLLWQSDCFSSCGTLFGFSQSNQAYDFCRRRRATAYSLSMARALKPLATRSRNVFVCSLNHYFVSVCRMLSLPQLREVACGAVLRIPHKPRRSFDRKLWATSWRYPNCERYLLFQNDVLEDFSMLFGKNEWYRKSEEYLADFPSG